MYIYIYTHVFILHYVLYILFYYVLYVLFILELWREYYGYILCFISYICHLLVSETNWEAFALLLFSWEVCVKLILFLS